MNSGCKRFESGGGSSPSSRTMGLYTFRWSPNGKAYLWLRIPQWNTDHNSTEILMQDLKISIPRHLSSSLTVVELLRIEKWPNTSVSLYIYIRIFINTHMRAHAHKPAVCECVTLLCSVGWKKKKKTAEDADTAGSGQLFVLWGTNRVHLHALSSSAFVIFNLNKNQLLLS